MVLGLTPAMGHLAAEIADGVGAVALPAVGIVVEDAGDEQFKLDVSRPERRRDLFDRLAVERQFRKHDRVDRSALPLRLNDHRRQEGDDGFGIEAAATKPGLSRAEEAVLRIVGVLDGMEVSAFEPVGKGDQQGVEVRRRRIGRRGVEPAGRHQAGGRKQRQMIAR